MSFCSGSRTYRGGWRWSDSSGRLRKKSESRRFAASGAKALADFARLTRR